MYCEKLNHIPIDNKNYDYDYAEVKASTDRELRGHVRIKNIYTPCKSIQYIIYAECEQDFEENGMDKMGVLFSAILYMIDNNITCPLIAYEAHCGLQDLETGEYDYLFTEKDLAEIKADMKIVREYLNQHPELTENVDMDELLEERKLLIDL